MLPLGYGPIERSQVERRAISRRADSRSSAAFSGVQRDRRIAAQQHARTAYALSVSEAQIREAAHQRDECDLTLEPGERGAQAEVRTEAERDVTVVGAGELEAVGVREHRRIAIRRSEQEVQLLV